MKTIVLTGGGTAGHVMPNLALLPDLKKHFDRIVYIGTENGIEKNLVKDKTEFFSVPASKLVRSLSPKNLLLPFKLLHSIREAKKLLKKINPSVVFSKGGFVAVPVVIAAKRLGIPVVSHESDLSMGLANKIIYRYCTYMCVSFEKTQKNREKCVFTGSPLRKELFNGQKENTHISFNNTKKTVLIFGGSLGAKAINKTVFDCVPELTKQFNIVHIVGKGNSNNIKCEGYVQKEFVQNMQDFFALSDLVISRGGANSLFELLALKKPTIIIPLPKEESRGDQIENAEYFQEKGYALVLEQKDLAADSLLKNLAELQKETPRLLENMNKNKTKESNQKIVELILKTMRI